MSSARVSPVIIIVTEESRRVSFIKDFFDHSNPLAAVVLSKTYLAEGSTVPITAAENTPDKVSGELAVLILKKIKDKFAKEKSIVSSEIRLLLKRLTDGYFTPTNTNTPNIRRCYDFLGNLLQCEKKYRTQYERRRDFFGEHNEMIRQVIIELRVQIKKDWKDLRENNIFIDKIANEVKSQHESEENFAYHIEQTIINKTNLYFEKVSSHFKVIRDNIELLLKKDYDEYQKLIKDRKTLFDLIDGKILGYVGLLGGGVMSALGTQVGSVLNEVVSFGIEMVSSVVNKKLNEQLKQWGKGLFNAIEQWDLKGTSEISDNQFIVTKEFIQDRVDQLRKTFLMYLYSEEFIRLITIIERNSLVKEKQKEKIIISSEEFEKLLKEKVNNKIFECTKKYMSVMDAFGKQLGVQKGVHALSHSSIKFINMFALGGLMVGSSWINDCADPLDKMKKGNTLDDVLQKIIPAGEKIQEFVRDGEHWIKSIKDENQVDELVKIMGFTQRKNKNWVSEKVTNIKFRYLGRDPEGYKDQEERRKLAFLSMYIIPQAFQKYCGTFLPEMMHDSSAKFNAIKEIIEFASHPVFRQKKPNMLLKILLSLPEMIHIMMEDDIRNWLINYLTPGVAARLQVPNELLKKMSEGRFSGLARNEFYDEIDKSVKFFDAINDKENVWVRHFEQDMELDKHAKKYGLHVVAVIPKDLKKIKPDSYFLTKVLKEKDKEKVEYWQLIYLNKKKNKSHIAINEVHGLAKIISDRSVEKISASDDDKAEIKKTISEYRNKVFSKIKPKTISAKSVAKEFKNNLDQSLVKGGIKNITELRFARLLLPYRHLLRHNLPFSLDLVNDHAHGYKYVYYLSEFIARLKTSKDLALLINPEKNTLEEAQEKMGNYVYDPLLSTADKNLFNFKKIILNAVVKKEYGAQKKCLREVRCDFLSVSSFRFQECMDLTKLPGESKFAYVLVEDNYFYVNKIENTCLRLKLDKKQLILLNSALSPNDKKISRELSVNELESVSSITGHFHIKIKNQRTAEEMPITFLSKGIRSQPENAVVLPKSTEQKEANEGNNLERQFKFDEDAGSILVTNDDVSPTHFSLARNVAVDNAKTDGNAARLIFLPNIAPAVNVVRLKSIEQVSHTRSSISPKINFSGESSNHSPLLFIGVNSISKSKLPNISPTKNKLETHTLLPVLVC